jgi:hypothetical protein
MKRTCNAPHIAATPAAANLPQTESASTGTPLSPISPSAPHTSSNLGSSLAGESSPRSPIRSVHEMTHRTSYRGHATGIGSLSGIPTPPWSHFVLAAPSTSYCFHLSLPTRPDRRKAVAKDDCRSLTLLYEMKGDSVCLYLTLLHRHRSWYHQNTSVLLS